MISKELTAASSSAFILSILAGGDSYGYQIIQTVQEMSAGQIQWTDGMLYPVLHRLEARALISARWRTAGSSRRRKYYRLTDQGRITLCAEKDQWLAVDSVLKRLWADCGPAPA